MKKFFLEQAFPLVMNGLNLIIFGIYLATHMLYLSWVLLLLDILGLKVSFDLLKKNENRASAVISLILFVIALLGAVGLTALAIWIMIGKFV